MASVKILDGAMGSELIKRGLSLPKHIWSAYTNIEAQEIISQIYKDYIEAGCDFITTNTFRTTPRSFQKTGLSIDDSKHFAKIALHNAIKIAHDSIKGEVNILGSIAPLEDCYKPELFPGYDIAKDEFSEITLWLNESNIDIFLIETMNNIKESIACIECAQEFDKPIWVSFVLKDDKHILSGETLIDTLAMLKNYNIDTVLLNCNPINRTKNAIDILISHWDKKWGIYPNLGIGEPSPDGIISNIHDDKEYIELIKYSLDNGVSYIGGCCGSSPYHINLLKNYLK